MVTRPAARVTPWIKDKVTFCDIMLKEISSKTICKAELSYFILVTVFSNLLIFVNDFRLSDQSIFPSFTLCSHIFNFPVNDVICKMWECVCGALPQLNLFFVSELPKFWEVVKLLCKLITFLFYQDSNLIWENRCQLFSKWQL